jgi:hypothetical protein
MAWRFALVPLLAMAVALSGCLTNRTITDVVAHRTYNNYKVQTLATYYAVFTVWVESEVWACHKDGHVFRCTELDYDAIKAGFKGHGPPVAAESAPVPPAAPAPPPPAAASPPPQPPAPAPAPPAPPRPAPPPPVAAPAPPPPPPAAAPPPPAPAPAPPAPAATPERSKLYDGPRN